MKQIAGAIVVLAGAILAGFGSIAPRDSAGFASVAGIFLIIIGLNILFFAWRSDKGAWRSDMGAWRSDKRDQD